MKKMKFFVIFLIGVILCILIKVTIDVYSYQSKLKYMYNDSINNTGEMLEYLYTKNGIFPYNLTEIAPYYDDDLFYKLCIDPNGKNLLKIQRIYNDERDSIVGGIIYSTGLYDRFYVVDTIRFTLDDVNKLNLIWDNSFRITDLFSERGVVIQAKLPKSN